MIDYRMDAEAADSALLILAMADGPVPDELMALVAGGETARGYAALITIAATRIAHSMNLEHTQVLPIIGQAAAGSTMTAPELSKTARGLDLIEAVWADDRDTIDAAMTVDRHMDSLQALASLCGFLFDLEAASTRASHGEVLQSYRNMAIRVLNG